MLDELPRQTLACEVPHFEHLDFLWANDVDKLVFPHVFEALEQYAGRERFRDRFSKSPLLVQEGREGMRKITERASEGEDEDRFWASSSPSPAGTARIAGESDSGAAAAMTKRSSPSGGSGSDISSKPKPKGGSNSLFQAAFGGHGRIRRTGIPRPAATAAGSPPAHHDTHNHNNNHNDNDNNAQKRHVDDDAALHRDSSPSSVRSLREKSFAEDGIRLGRGEATIGLVGL